MAHGRYAALAGSQDQYDLDIPLPMMMLQDEGRRPSEHGHWIERRSTSNLVQYICTGASAGGEEQAPEEPHLVSEDA